MPNVLRALPHAHSERERREGLLDITFQTAAVVLAAVGLVHLVFVLVFGFNLIAEALGVGPVGVAAVETVLTLAAVYVIAIAVGRG
ncbi:MAG: hypothetical protein ABW067_17860 [Rhizobacter sp.]|jgi:hypothetical protein